MSLLLHEGAQEDLKYCFRHHFIWDDSDVFIFSIVYNVEESLRLRHKVIKTVFNSAQVSPTAPSRSSTY